MKFMVLFASASALIASTSQAATLVHDYEFAADSTTTFYDSVGSVNGTLNNGATVSGGYLLLDGSNDYGKFDSLVFPTGGTSFSLFFSFTDHTNQGTYAEVVSQDGGSFYIGQDPSNHFRVSDSNLSTSAVFPSDGATHGVLLTNNGVNSRVYVDGALVFTGSPVASTASGGSAYVGKQYSCCGEYFQGSIDAIRIYSGIASYAEASTAPAVPEPASWAMMIGGFGMTGAAMRRTRAKLRFA
jgi:hypothetical protein